MKQYLLRMFRYNAWANNLVVNIIDQTRIQDETILAGLSHILNAEIIWYERINYGQSTVSEDIVHNLSELPALYKDISEKYRGLLRDADETELDRHRSYIDNEENTYSYSLKDILAHVLYHSTHHRAKIIFRMEQLDFEPPDTDYIYYLQLLERT